MCSTHIKYNIGDIEMTDRILVWFQCANESCELITKLGHKATFLSYVLGRKENTEYEIAFVPEDDSIPRIVMWNDIESKVNSYLNPIKGIRYCKRCYELVVKNESLERYW